MWNDRKLQKALQNFNPEEIFYKHKQIENPEKILSKFKKPIKLKN